jgi:hypothetical protein
MALLMALLMNLVPLGEFIGAATLHFWHRSARVCGATGISGKIPVTKSGGALWIT